MALFDEVPLLCFQVYVRPAGSYVMDQLELHRVNSYSQVDSADIADCVVLIGNFVVPAGLRAAEAHLSDQQVINRHRTQ